MHSFQYIYEKIQKIVGSDKTAGSDDAKGKSGGEKSVMQSASVLDIGMGFMMWESARIGIPLWGGTL